MVAGRWQRLALAIALFALTGTPAARAFCAAVCDPSTAHAGHAPPAGATTPAHVHLHAAEHPQAGGGVDARVTSDALPCDDLTVVAVAGHRASVVAAPPTVAMSAHRLAPPSAARSLSAARTPWRPPGRAAAPLPLRI